MAQLGPCPAAGTRSTFPGGKIISRLEPVAAQSCAGVSVHPDASEVAAALTIHSFIIVRRKSIQPFDWLSRLNRGEDGGTVKQGEFSV
jgi:hypothetical protein